MAFQQLLRVCSVKHVEQKAFESGLSHRGFPGCVDWSCQLGEAPTARYHHLCRSRSGPASGPDLLRALVDQRALETRGSTILPSHPSYSASEVATFYHSVFREEMGCRSSRRVVKPLAWRNRWRSLADSNTRGKRREGGCLLQPWRGPQRPFAAGEKGAQRAGRWTLATAPLANLR